MKDLLRSQMGYALVSGHCPKYTHTVGMPELDLREDRTVVHS